MSRKFPPHLGIYHWRDTPNFGDSFGPILLKHFTNAKVDWTTPRSADIVVVGSVLDVLPDGWDGIIAGAGFLSSTSSLRLSSQATVLGVRGPLTAEMLGAKDYVTIGDPGLLMSELVPTFRNLHKFGVVPHCTDTELFKREYERAVKYDYARPIYIDPTADPLTVVAQIGSCERIVSSSLHGLVVADSFHIPRRAEKFADMDRNPYEGGDFKFRDYGLSIDQPIEWGTLQSPSKDKIQEIQINLFKMFQKLNGIINAD